MLEILETLEMGFSEEWFVVKIASKCWVKSRMGVIFFPFVSTPFLPGCEKKKGKWANLGLSN